MANASRHHMGPAAQGKNSGTGAMTSESVADGIVGENQVLSNRDKTQHSRARGLDGKAVQTDQHQDHVMNQQKPNVDAAGNDSGLSAPMSTTSAQDGSLKSRQGESGGLAEPKSPAGSETNR